MMVSKGPHLRTRELIYFSCVCVCVFRIKEWTEQMQRELIALVDTATGMEHLVQVRLMFSKVVTSARMNDQEVALPSKDASQSQVATIL